MLVRKIFQFSHTVLTVSHTVLTVFLEHPHRKMMAVSIGKYCQFIIFTNIFGEYKHHTSQFRTFGEPSPCPLNFLAMPAGLSVKVISKVP